MSYWVAINSSLESNSALRGKERGQRRRRKKWASKASRGVVWGGKGWSPASSPTAFFPSPVHRSARFPRRLVFAILPCFSTFSPLRILVPGYINSRQCVLYNQPRTELNFRLCATAPKFLLSRIWVCATIGLLKKPSSTFQSGWREIRNFFR